MKRAFLLLVLVLTLSPGLASAQEETKIGPFAVDAHGSLARLGPKDELAAPYGLTASDLPSRGLGLDVAAHWYPVSWRAVTFGFGVGLHTSRGHQGPTETDAQVSGADVTVRFTALSPQISFNFGSGTGWSYLSGGLGYSTYAITTPDFPEDQTTRRKTINYGFGARWFTRDHLAFSFDLRFYAISPQAAADGAKQAPRMTLMVFSAGVSLK